MTYSLSAVELSRAFVAALSQLHTRTIADAFISYVWSSRCGHVFHTARLYGICAINHVFIFLGMFQMLTLTYPMIGNYGVPDRSLRDEFGLAKHFESDKIHASALLVQVRWIGRDGTRYGTIGLGGMGRNEMDGMGRDEM